MFYPYRTNGVKSPAVNIIKFSIRFCLNLISDITGFFYAD